MSGPLTTTALYRLNSGLIDLLHHGHPDRDTTAAIHLVRVMCWNMIEAAESPHLGPDIAGLADSLPPDPGVVAGGEGAVQIQMEPEQWLDEKGSE